MRLDIEKQKELEPKRMEYAMKELTKIGIAPLIISNKRIEFEFKGESVMLYPYSGWFTGKSVQDGRGIEKLLKQLKNNNNKL